MLLTVNHLYKTYHRQGQPFFAVKDVSFRLKSGEILVVAGESGSGKSTLCRLICQFIQPDKGQILLHDQDITHVPVKKQKELYRHIQMVFQQPYRSFHPRYTLKKSVLMGVKNYHLPLAKEQWENLLREVHLSPSLLERYPRQVSGGECQRAALLRALLLSPELLICDEATSALDADIRLDLAALIQHICKRHHIACLFVTHDLDLAQKLADRILIMHNGQIIESGTTKEIFEQPKETYTKELLAARL